MRNWSSAKLRAAGCITVLAFGSTFTMWGKDFWEEKPFTQWTEQEAMKLLSESPWARTQTVMAGTMSGVQQQSNSDRVKSLPRLGSAAPTVAQDCRRQECHSALAIRSLSLSDGTHRREFAKLWAGWASFSRTCLKRRSESSRKRLWRTIRLP